MSFLRLHCPASGNRGWSAWLPAVVLLVVITIQLIDRASHEPAESARTETGTETAVIGTERTGGER